jgi:tetratricopeptide (TPR) repeat protein
MAGDLADPAHRAAKLRELAERDPADAATWFALGRTQLELEQSEEAADAFRRAIEANPDYTAAHRDLGRALLALGRAEEAAGVLAGALDIADRNGDLQTRREMEVFLGRAEKALGREAPPRAPRPSGPAPDREVPARSADPEARRIAKQAFEHFANGRLDEAIEGYRRALAIDPGLAIAWNGLSLTYRQQGDLAAAIEAGEKLIELEPDDPLSHTNLSILYMRNGMIPEAEEEKAVAMQLQMKSQRAR